MKLYLGHFGLFIVSTRPHFFWLHLIDVCLPSRYYNIRYLCAGQITKWERLQSNTFMYSKEMLPRSEAVAQLATQIAKQYDWAVTDKRQIRFEHPSFSLSECSIALEFDPTIPKSWNQLNVSPLEVVQHHQFFFVRSINVLTAYEIINSDQAAWQKEYRYLTPQPSGPPLVIEKSKRTVIQIYCYFQGNPNLCRTSFMEAH